MTKTWDRLRSMAGELLAVAAAVALVAASAVVFSGAFGVVEVTQQAELRHRADVVLGTASTLQTAVGEVVTIGTARDAGVSSPEEVSRAVREVRMALANLDERFQALVVMTESPEALGGSYDAWAQAVAGVLRSIEEGETERARNLAADTLGPSYDTLVQGVVDERFRADLGIEVARSEIGRVLFAARFVVAFFVPLLILLGYRRAVRRQRQRERLEAELEQERAVAAAKTEFLTAVAHQLRTPLTAVVGFAEVLREGRRDFNAGERNELIELIADHATEVGNLVEDFVVSRRTELGELRFSPEVFDLRHIIEQAAAGLGRRQRRRLLVSGAGFAYADPHRVRQVVRNLLQNALVHGGEQVEVQIAQEDGRAVLRVADDGPALPESDETRIFEPYYVGLAAKGAPPRLGLGLSVARGLARLMDGDVVFRRADERNTFELALPHSEPGVGETWVHRSEDRRYPTSADILEVVSGNPPRIVFQPIVDLDSIQQENPQIVGFEALSRFRWGRPEDWFAAAAEVGLRVEVECAAAAAAVADFSHLRESAVLAINVSTETLLSSRLLEALEPLVPGQVIFELSEEATINSYQVVEEALANLVDLGYRLAVDDVGKGETDLWHIARLRPQLMKLDISLTRDIHSNARHRAIVKGLIGVAGELGIAIVAEGIETKSEFETVQRLGIRLGQGYYLGKPEPIDAQEWLVYESLAIGAGL